MIIGELVRHYIPKIIHYCENTGLEEIGQLKNQDYCKRVFDINYSFWMPSDDVDGSKRYWKHNYEVNNTSMRVTNDWYAKNIESFKKYLIDKKITTGEELDKMDINTERTNNNKLNKKIRSNSRYKGNAIGNAQNLLVRNILSNLGDEVFTENDWKNTKDFFNNSCAYCGSIEKLVMEHAVPINKTMLGEHRLGNIVPSCNKCNHEKSSQSYKQFLKDGQRVEKIEEYMRSKNYKSLGSHENSEIIAELLEKAYLDTAEVAKRYVAIIELVQNENIT